MQERIERLEKWCLEHENEGLDYGNEIEDELETMRNSLVSLAKQLMLITDAVLILNKNIERILEL